MAYTTINDPSANFQTTIYTGNGSTQNITNGGNSDLKPDWVWIKDRSASNDHKLTDSTRGTTYTLESNANTAQYNDTGSTTAYLTDGFSLGSNGNVNTNSNNYVAWQWKATGGTTSTNSDGSITSTVQANTSAGFSIVKWTGTGSNGTVGHGLGVAPDCIFFKNYTATENWTTYHSVLGNSGGLYLNLNNQFNTASSWYQDTSPTSSSFYVGTNSKTNGGTMVAYCFANIKGYSKFGKYTGNNNADGPFIYTGFKPAYFCVKGTDITQNWQLWDNKRNDYPNNPRQEILSPSSSSTESGNYNVDFLANGVKIRDTDGAWNGNGNNYVYLAFAVNPLVATNNVTATAG